MDTPARFLEDNDKIKNNSLKKAKKGKRDMDAAHLT
jgi:hypothetical protein